jgi:hypothetical protein
MLNVFSDLHHFGLFNSLHLLFEGRLGGKLYRPIGEEWLTRGYWKMAEIYNNHPATVAQYLGNKADYETEERGGVYPIWDNGHGFTQNAITIDRFMNEPIDIIIASIPQHIESFARLAEAHPNKPKLIYQIGNQWDLVITSPIKNVMASAKLPYRPPGFNIIEYHQEFDTNVFRPSFLTDLPPKNIRSFVNCFNTASIYSYDWDQFLQLEKMMPDWKLESFGGSCRDGNANGINEVAEKIRDSMFVWHVKYAGDGYGHVLHSAAACGQPVIFKKAYYVGKLGDVLLRDGETGIQIDGLSLEQVKNKILHYSDHMRWRALSENIYRIFRENVDFDLEELAIRQFLQNLV